MSWEISLTKIKHLLSAFFLPVNFFCVLADHFTAPRWVEARGNLFWLSLASCYLHRVGWSGYLHPVLLEDRVGSKFCFIFHLCVYSVSKLESKLFVKSWFMQGSSCRNAYKIRLILLIYNLIGEYCWLNTATVFFQWKCILHGTNKGKLC